MLPQSLTSYSLPILLLLGSNIFMTTVWYWHLRFKEVPLFSVILTSWALAFVEYCLAVPTNRFRSAVYSQAQLKTIQEVITLIVFAGFSAAYLRICPDCAGRVLRFPQPSLLDRAVIAAALDGLQYRRRAQRIATRKIQIARSHRARCGR